MNEFTVGQRVTFSAEGRRRWPRNKRTGGTVIAFGRYPGTVRVLFDGNLRPETYQLEYFELDKSETSNR